MNGVAIAGDKQVFSASASTVAGVRNTNAWFDQLPSGKTCTGLLWLPKATINDVRRSIMFLIPKPLITSLGFESDVVSGLGINTELRFYKND